MKNKKILEVSEFQRFQTNIESLTGASAASRGLITSSIEDLKTTNAEITSQLNSISELISKLDTQKNELKTIRAQNLDLIEKLQVAVAEYESNH